MLKDCKTLSDYFDRYGEILGARANDALAPLHLPSRDPILPGVDLIDEHVKLARNSVLFGAQKDVLCGIVKALHRQKTVILAAECGTGKSLMGCASAHVHAAGRPYRGLVMCPDHLIKKWGREIERTCPGARWRYFDDWKEMLAAVQQGGYNTTDEVPGLGMGVTPDTTYSVNTGADYGDDGLPIRYHSTDWKLSEPPDSGIVKRIRKWEPEPQGAEWWIVGRDQSKGDPTWEHKVAVRKQFLMDPVAASRLVKKGVKLADMVAEVAACPKCGRILADKDGNPRRLADVLAGKKKLVCEGTFEASRTRWSEKDRAWEQQWVEVPCLEPLWSFVAARTKEERATRTLKRAAAGQSKSSAPFRWPPYRIVKGLQRRPFDYLILDEVHELKGTDSIGQANAAGAFISCSRKVIALTGTLIGGYADHVFPMLIRMAPRSFVAMGMGWNQFNKFNSVYGKIETTIHTRSGGKSEGTSNSHTKGGSSEKTTRKNRPGIMPQLYGDHLIDKAVFLSLDQVSEGLPALYETLIPIDMDPEQAKAYGKLEGWLRSVVKQMIARGDKRLLGTMLESLLYYPDHPFEWPMIESDEGSFQPADLDDATVRPKEAALIEYCKREKAEDRKVWVYIQRTNVRDVGKRLAALLTKAGLRTGYLRASVPPREREEWIYKHGKGLDVCLSHPDLVKTGLDLFAPDGNHNFPTLAYYQ